MRGRFPTEDDQRTLDIAGDSIDVLLLQQISEKHPEAQLSIFMARAWKEAHGFVGAPQGRVVVTAPIAGKPTKLPSRCTCRRASPTSATSRDSSRSPSAPAARTSRSP